VAPKLVREHVRDQMRANALRATDRRALELYFGAKWNSGDLKKSPTAKRVKNALCDGYEIQNASVVIHRVIRRAIESDADIEVGGVIRLASSFAASLFTGHHFRSTSALCSDLIELLKDLPQFDAQVAVLEYQNGRSLRMMGRTEEAQDQLLKADVSHLSKDQKQVLKLELALCADRLNDRERAVSAANEAIAIDRHSAPAIHARAILAGHIEDLDERERVLRGLLVTAEKKKSRIVANNIRIDIASIRTARGESSSEMLRDVLASQDRVRDFYNEARAIIRIIKARSSEEEVAPEDKRRLIEAYHYLYGERLMSMFDDCHDVLWNLFKHEGDDENLLNLFRRSSFVWRLSGSENKERKYLTALSSKVREMVRSRINQLSRDGAYLIVRVTAVLGLTSVQQAKSD